MRLVSLEAAGSLVWARISLRRAALAEVRRRWSLAGPVRREPVSRDQLRRALELGWTTMHVARRLPLQFTCLAQSIALLTMLRRRGIPAEVRLGVKSGGDDQAIAAHAWVECGGRVVLDVDAHASFVPLEQSVPRN